MALTAPSSLAALKPFLVRADQFERGAASNPTLGKIVYYLRFAAASLGVQALNAGAGADAAANAFLNELVNRIDADKQKYGVVAEQEDDDIAFLTKYAMGLFKRSDDSDRAGASDQAVGQTFATVGFLLDAVRHVAKEPDARLAQVAKYAKGRAADIMLALKEGRAPPPPAGGVDLFAELGFDLPPPPSGPPSDAAGGSSSHMATEPFTASPVPPPSASPSAGSAYYGGSLGPSTAPASGPAPESASHMAASPFSSPFHGVASPPAGAAAASAPGGGAGTYGGGAGAYGGPSSYGGGSAAPASAGYGMPLGLGAAAGQQGHGGVAGGAAAYPSSAAASPYAPGVGVGAPVAPPPAAAPSWQSPHSTGSVGSSSGVGRGRSGAGARHGLPPAVMHDARELTKHALAALKEEDPAAAAALLRQALSSLGM